MTLEMRSYRKYIDELVAERRLNLRRAGCPAKFSHLNALRFPSSVKPRLTSPHQSSLLPVL
ncbi:hypothetical protein TMatcc_010588 [Talaromyces marneffei ATCC 18224]